MCRVENTQKEVSEMAVNQRIRKYLEEHGIKQQYLADKLGVKKELISAMLCGRRKITAEELGMIAGVLKVNPNIFLNVDV